ncbi:MAG: SDR family NAD(P)-dependent oxidoreductase [Chryseobacterium taeanense]
MRRFENKVVLVVGSTQGIGKAIVERFVQEGATVAFTDITDNGFEQEEQYRKNGSETYYIQADATNEDSVRETVAAVVSRFGRIDIAINNVGGQMKSDTPNIMFHETKTQGWNDTKNLTENSIYYYMREELAQMVKQGGGVIGNTASGAGLKPQFALGVTPAYSGAKASIMHLTRYTAIQYARLGIRVNAVAPGGVSTETLKNTLSAEQQQSIIDKVQPNGRFVEPEEIAAAFAYLCSDDAVSVTGVTLPVDGGLAAS